MKAYLREKGLQFEDSDWEQIIEKVKRPQLDKLRRGNEIHIIEWNTGFICWNLVHPELNQNPIWLQLSKYSSDEVSKIKSYLGRYEAFFEKCIEYGVNYLGYDAEQSYLAHGCNALVEQFNLL
jgi:hypothetical protein